MNEGQQVTYVGPGTDRLSRGDTGMLMAFAGGEGGHVLWRTGRAEGEATLEYLEDLSTGHTATHDPLEDSLEVGGLAMQGVRETYATEGEAGVLNVMAEAGHLAAFSDIAEEALSLVASRVRQDPSFREVTGQLDEEAGEALLRLASICLIRDAFGDPETD